ncbi:LCP family protein [Natronosporangium hydrolyticum]|uniref:LCP family protein n=1 Tax=Natronosporangium hydrolyticum TaxID=2811111 RepID=A0A895YFS9_9ACTN|nr:LCP family protein [Natronosporangium hydrolyticum]QSB14962.1 LCP family protein [Natronosporangium hydrolyticum]
MASHRRAAPRWAVAALVTGLILVVAVTTTAVGGFLLLDRWQRAVPQEELLDPADQPPTPERPASPRRRPAPAPEGAGDPVTGPLNYLVVGTDQRPDNPGQAAFADAIVVVHIPAGLREAYLVSIPRDLRVDIPGHGTDKINAAYRVGGGGAEGVSLLADTLYDLTGVTFDGAAILDFAGFEAVVDALGGVEMCLTRSVRSIHTGHVFPTGCQRLRGAEALDLARQRYDLPAGDFDRGRHHQQLIQAMVAQARSEGLVTNPIQLDRTIRAIGSAVTIDTGGVALPELVYALRQLRPDRMTGITVPSYSQRIDGISYVLAEPAATTLYQALRDAQLHRWVEDHPEWHND